MRIHKGYRVELDPNNAQRTHLAKHAGCARFAYNWGLARRIAEYKATGNTSSAVDQHKQLCALKKTEFQWMYECSKCAPQEALRNLERAYKSFFRRCKKGAKRKGFPKFKSRRRGLGGFCLLGCIHVEEGRIKLPRLGWIRLKERGRLPVNAKIGTVFVKERAGRWFVSAQVEEEIAVAENQGPAVGLDLGLHSFAVLSDGSEIVSPRPLSRSLERLKRLSRWHSRKRKGSMNRRKSARGLARLHYRVSCRRSDFLHKATTRLARTKSAIAVESLGVRGMMGNHRLARSISDAGWAEFVRQLEYKCQWHGSKLVKADRFFASTKTCSGCGEKRGMPLSERTYRCGKCGLVLDRDVNAARNLLALHTASSAGIDACGEDRQLAASPKQEPDTGAVVSVW